MVAGMGERSVLPPDQYVASLTRKRMAASAFFRDPAGRVLLVDPVYKESWDILRVTGIGRRLGLREVG